MQREDGVIEPGSHDGYRVMGRAPVAMTTWRARRTPEYENQTSRPRTWEVVLRELTNRNHAANSQGLGVYGNRAALIDHLLGELFKFDQIKASVPGPHADG